jgi:hypothetical protein
MERSLTELGIYFNAEPLETQSLADLGSRFPRDAPESHGSTPVNAPGNSVYRALNRGTQWLVDNVGPAIPPELRAKLRGVGELLNMVNPATSYREYNDAMRRERYGEAALNALGLIPGEALAAGAAKLAALPLIPVAKVSAASMPTGAVGSGKTKFEQAIRGDLFDYSNLSKAPSVQQFDLPRYIPPRGVPQRTLDITNDKVVRDKMLETISAGRDRGAVWFNAEPLRHEFVKTLGEEAGNARFRRFIDLVAATSPRSDVGQNVRNASYYYGRDVRGEGMPVVGDRNPAPYGHLAQYFHQINARRVVGDGFDPLKNPKMLSMSENLMGNYAPVTVDANVFKLPAMLAQDPRFLETAFRASKDAPKQNIQAMVMSSQLPMNEAVRRPAYWQAQPRSNEYAAWEQYYKGLAREVGVSPAQAEAAAWLGGGKITGLVSDSSKPFLRFVEDRINLTAERYRMDPKDVLARFIRGEMPLLSMGGGVLSLGAIGQQQQEHHQ